ncbi:hypothetical protein HMPREF0868_1566 [Mageeibacillus indolicus UPII9-5]|uniref:Uncharacterized protein n=1 Tax=Mageeibacillus indolicus (strain UPII9-5) TaxID=699246 RepID=D3QZC6_MAGIU|nr:hypothetical protein HMPREF0868_1566 [Mageeibacillus indolicus UPII9-5]
MMNLQNDCYDAVFFVFMRPQECFKLAAHKESSIRFTATENGTSGCA